MDVNNEVSFLDVIIYFRRMLLSICLGFPTKDEVEEKAIKNRKDGQQSRKLRKWETRRQGDTVCQDCNTIGNERTIVF